MRLLRLFQSLAMTMFREFPSKKYFNKNKKYFNKTLIKNKKIAYFKQSLIIKTLQFRHILS